MERIVLLAIHWYWVAFFVTFGIFLMNKRRNFGSVNSACCTFRVAACDSDMGDRLRAAIERRQQAEGEPAPLGLYMGGASIAAGVLLAVTRLEVGVLYPLFCLCVTLMSALAYWHLRNAQPVRVALLSVRRSEAVVPPYWFLMAAIASLSVLAYAPVPQLRTGAIVVCASGLLATLVAWRLTALPAMLSGVDIPAEQLVDERVRLYRSSACLVFAVVQGFVFCTQALVETTPLQLAANILSGSACFAFAVWFVLRMRGAVRAA